MREILRQMGRSGIILAGFAMVSVLVVAATYHGTRERITRAQQQALAMQLDTLVPPARYDNQPTADTLQLRDAAFGSDSEVSVYRARKAGQPVALLTTIVAADGYAGPIQLLVAVNADGRLAGVRVLSHKETPGLGDAIDIERSNWISHFDGRSLDDPAEAQWKVKKDGGVFDQFTGATITPRAVVKAVHRFLEYERDHRAALYAAEKAQ